MLDLSRLEAGKVKLSRDDFSLIALTRSIFEKLEMAAQAKDLQIDFNFPDDFTITADESRIAQVVENFATNAIKYAPTGGHISVTIQTDHSSTSFHIENDSEPLSSEALSKVWDTFYRTDEARSGGGTGLGLAIAKSIVDLHGGKCSVRNTKSGVEFGFHNLSLMHNSLWNKGRTSIQGQTLYARSARRTAWTVDCPSCFASLRSEQGVAPLAPLCGYPCTLCGGNNLLSADSPRRKV